MKKKTLIITLCVAVAVVAVLAAVLLNRAPSSLTIVNNEDGTVEVTAENAARGSGAIGYITLEDGQELKVRSYLTDGSSIKIEVLPANVDAATDVLFEETFTAVDVGSFELPAGDYTLRITAEKGATGSMTVKAE